LPPAYRGELLEAVVLTPGGEYRCWLQFLSQQGVESDQLCTLCWRQRGIQINCCGLEVSNYGLCGLKVAASIVRDKHFAVVQGWKLAFETQHKQRFGSRQVTHTER
jgi:hypothetical protein